LKKTRAIGQEVGCTTGTASKWRVRYAERRRPGLDETGDRKSRNARNCGPETGAPGYHRRCTLPASKYGLSRPFGSMRRPQASTNQGFLDAPSTCPFLGRGDLVADAFAGDFPLELGEG
jgi:hypothetical protein